MKQKLDLIEIIDEEIILFFQTKNEVMHEYVPIIGATGFLLYSFYKSMANRGAGNAAFPSYELVRKHLGLATSTTNRYNWLLEQCGLIKIVRGNARSNNIYRLLKVNVITSEFLDRLTQVLQPNPTDGREWAKFKAATLETVQNWQPLRAHFRNHATEPDVELVVTTNDNAPRTDAESNQDELVAHLVVMFKDNKLSKAAATKMIEQYGVEAVRQQLAWLPNRQTDTPLRTLRAALKDNWTEPKPVGKPEPEPYWKGTHLDPALNPMPIIVENSRPKPTTPAEMWDEVAAETFGAPIVGTRLMGVEGNVWIVECENFIQQEKLYKLNGALTKATSYTAEQEVALKFVIKEDMVVK